MTLQLGVNAAKRYGLSADQEAFARFLADLLNGTPFTPAEIGEFEAAATSREHSAAVGNAVGVRLAAADTRRKQLIVNLTNSLSPIVVGGSDQVAFGAGLPIAAGAERAFGDFTGEVWGIANVAGPLDVRIREEF